MSNNPRRPSLDETDIADFAGSPRGLVTIGIIAAVGAIAILVAVVTSL